MLFRSSRVWKGSGGEWTSEGYAGRSDTSFRYWLRDGVPGVVGAGPVFGDLTVKGVGLLLTHKTEERSLRVGIHRAHAAADTPFPATFPFVLLAPGLGYFQTNPALPGPGIAFNDKVVNTLLTFSAEWQFSAATRGVAEFARVVTKHDDLGPQGNRGHAAVLHRVGKWTPYIDYAFLRSPARQRTLYAQLDSIRLPDAVPGAALINVLQRVAADNLLVYDQHSWALGTSYALTLTSKVKAEYTLTRIGGVSALEIGRAHV